MPSDREAFYLLAVRYLDEELTDEEFATFDRVLAEDPEARRRFRQVSLNAALLREFGSCQPARPARWRRVAGSLAGLAAAILVVFWFALPDRGPRGVLVGRAPSMPPEPVGRERIEEPSRPSVQPPSSHARLPDTPDWLRVTAYDGAAAAGRGDGRLRLSSGELRVDVLRPGPGRAVRLITPAGTIACSRGSFLVSVMFDLERTTMRPKPGQERPMKRTQTTRVLVLAGALTLTNTHGAITGSTGALLASEPNAAPRQVAAASTDFGFELYRRLASAQPGKNLVLSPHSISTAFAMAYEGARDRTAAQMAKVFRWTRPPAEGGRQLAWERARLRAGMGQLARALDQQKAPYVLRVANAMWGGRQVPFRPTFLQALTGAYGADGLRRLDFARDPEAARRQVNQWVEEQTNQRIKELMPRGSIKPNTILVLANAIYFLGNWQYPFNKLETGPGVFTCADERQVKVPMMSRDTSRFRHAGVSHGQLLELPYKGGRLAMILLLPDRGRMAALERALSHRALAGWLASLRKRRLQLRVPRFELSSGFDLGKVLPGMGMTDAFDAHQADFSGLLARGPRVWIGAARHKAFIAVNETGTEAAAATGIGMAAQSVPPRFHCDRPFLFLIRDGQTGAILFMGKVADPGGK